MHLRSSRSNECNALSWLTQRTYNLTGNGWVSKTWYMYLDNIRVTIVK